MLHTHFLFGAAKTNRYKMAAAICAVSGVALFSNSASAQDTCSVSAWDDGATTAVTADAVLKTRYKGKCGLKAVIADNDLVAHSTQFNDEPSVISLFYVLRPASTTIGSSDTVTIYRMLDSADSTVLQVNIEGDNAVLSVGATATASVALASGWNSIVVNASSAADATITVNDTAGTAAGGQLSAGVSSIQLGAIDSTGSPAGDLIFDYYLANRSNVPALLVNCNANGSTDDIVNGVDVAAAIEEALGGELATGTPDCSADGVINGVDVAQIIDIALSN